MGLLRRQIELFLSLTISLSLILSPLQTQAQGLGNHAQRAMAEEAFFYDLRFRIEQFMQANLAKITQLRLCIKAEINPAKYVNVNKAFCKEELTTVKENVRILYPRMRHYLILRQLMPLKDLGTYENFDLTVPNLSKTISNIEYNNSIKNYSPLIKSFISAKLPTKQILLKLKFKDGRTNIQTAIEFENPLDSNFDKIKMPFAQPNETEIMRAILGFPDNKGEVQEWGHGVAQFFKTACNRPKTIDAKYCNASTLTYSKTYGYTAWQTSLKNVPNSVHNRFNNMMKDRNMRETNPRHRTLFGLNKGQRTPTRFGLDLDKKLEGKYYEIIQKNPYIALVSSAKPNNQQLLWAFDQMFQSSSRTLQRFLKLKPKLDRGSRDDLVGLMSYTPAVGHLVELPGSNMDLMYGYPFDQLSQELNDENSVLQFKKMGLQVAGLIAANVVICWLPWSKVGSTIGRGVKIAFTGGKISNALKPMCYALTSIPINTYFLLDAVHLYSIAYQEIFSGMDENMYSGESNSHFVREIESLTAAQQSIFWTALFMPTGTKEVRIALKNNIPALSKNAWQRIERYLQKRGH